MLGKIVDQNPMSQAIPCPMSTRCNCRAAHRSTNVGTRTVDRCRVDRLKHLFPGASHHPALGTPLGISAPYPSAAMRISGQSREAVPKEELTPMLFAASAFRSSYTTYSRRVTHTRRAHYVIGHRARVSDLCLRINKAMHHHNPI